VFHRSEFEIFLYAVVGEAFCAFQSQDSSCVD
jgi:hypothetical protein